MLMKQNVNNDVTKDSHITLVSFKAVINRINKTRKIVV